MSYNAKKQNTAVLALALAAILIFSNKSYAEETAIPQEVSVNQKVTTSETPADENENVFGLDEEALTKDNPPAENKTEDDNFLNEENTEVDALFSDTTEDNNKPQTDEPAQTESQPENFGLDAENTVESSAESTEEPVAEGPKSPFERFGNAILSKVDNDLFNQMSKIEKQTTLLNLEYKREELKNRVEALRAQRRKAQDEENNRLLAQEKRLKDEETQRQAKIIEAEAMLKEKEIELEKARQNKVVNDYMNEMLLINQKWIERNAELQTRIRDLEEDRQELIEKFEAKISDLAAKAEETNQKSKEAFASHLRTISSKNIQIDQLKVSLRDAENRVLQYQSGDNPFADDESIGRDAIDMSEQYAIMDITGKGHDIVAKIVSKDGTTFMVRPGSMLKGGEIVTSITDKYISFDNNGIKSYLYTSGTVLEYEPTLSFNGSDKTPEQTTKKSIKEEIRNVRGQQPSTTKEKENKNEEQAQPASEPRKGSLSFGQSMFIK